MLRNFSTSGQRWLGRGARVVAAAVVVGTVCAEPARGETDVQYILDVSGSMTQKIGSESKMVLAEKALMSSIGELKPGQLAALRVYGHRVEQTKKAESCKDTELLIPFHAVNREEFAKKLTTLTPKGYTPIAYSLEQSRNDLLDVGVGKEAKRVIILLTDGEETCDGDPVAVLKKLKAEGFDLTVYTVGFAVEEVARKQLTEIAEVTGGKYFDAKDGAQLNEALKNAAKESVTLLDKSRAVYGNAIRGGDSYEQAVKLEPGKEYRLDHHQKKDDFDYFYVETKPGTEVAASIRSLNRGISLSGKQPEETQRPYGGLQLHTASHEAVRKLDIIGDTAKKETATYRPNAGDRMYVLMGSTYESMHKDNILFQVDLAAKGDLGGAVDAGDTFETALPVESKRYDKNYIGDNDKIDVFKLDAKSGDQLVVGAVPSKTMQGYFTVRVLDEFRQQLADKSSGFNAGIKTDPVKLPDDGTYYIEVGYPSGNDVAEYSLVIKRTQVKEGGAANAAPPPPTPPAEEPAPEPSQQEGATQPPQ